MPPRIGNTLNVPTNDKVYARTPRTANILDVFNMATEEEISYGMRWYQDAHDIATRIANGNTSMGAGVLASLSPMTPWDRNIILAELAFSQGYASLSLSKNCAKADKVMAGIAPLDVLGGDKVRNFYLAILDGSGVVIDRHAFDIAVGRATNDLTRGALSRKGVYAAFSRKYVIAASKASEQRGETITPSQMQAITWETWRRLKGIV